MDKNRQVVVDKIASMELAIARTSSPYLRRDYIKAVKWLKAELRTYDKYKSLNNRIGAKRW